MNIRTDQPMKKLNDKRYGLFKIKKKVRAGAYELKLPKSWKPIYLVFNEFLLSQFKAPTNPSQQRPLPPPPEIIDQVPEYEVEDIVDSRKRRGQLKYLIHWKGYLQEERTWEPMINLVNAQGKIKEFHRLHPNAKKTPLISINQFTSPHSNSIIPINYCRYNDNPKFVSNPEEVQSILLDMANSYQKMINDPFGKEGA